ncbi:MAG: DHH family phosphoesterase [Candidatus Omnitrophota bacterium]
MTKNLQTNIRRAAQALRKAKKIVVICHINPDGDTLGCQLALGLALIDLKKKVVFFSQDGVPSRFQFLPGSELVVSETREKADVAVAVDCGSVQQLGKGKDVFFRAKTTMTVDHHNFGAPFGKIRVQEDDAAAVGEIVYEVIRALRVEITPAIATSLLTSIIVDTGSFRFANIRARTFEICGDLVRTGVDLRYLIEESYWKKSRPMALLSGYCLARARFSKDGTAAWSVVTRKDLDRFGAHLWDADPVADDLRTIEGVQVSALFRETEKGCLRVSLRSDDRINVARVAKRFGGGGHHNSAGCVIRNSEKEKRRLLKELEALVS